MIFDTLNIWKKKRLKIDLKQKVFKQNSCKKKVKQYKLCERNKKFVCFFFSKLLSCQNKKVKTKILTTKEVMRHP